VNGCFFLFILKGLLLHITELLRKVSGS